MNRIVLIGNGFDLAHGLPTGYVDFINNYWENFSYHVLNGYERWQLENYGISPIRSYSDNFANLKVINKGSDEITEFTVTDNEKMYSMSGADLLMITIKLEDLQNLSN